MISICYVCQPYLERSLLLKIRDSVIVSVRISVQNGAILLIDGPKHLRQAANEIMLGIWSLRNQRDTGIVLTCRFT